MLRLTLEGRQRCTMPIRRSVETQPPARTGRALRAGTSSTFMSSPLRSSIVVLLVALTPVFAESPADTYTLSDHGQIQKFVVATDEIHGGRTVKRIKVARDGREVRTVAAASADELVLYPAGAAHTPANRRLLTKRLAVQLAPGTDPASVAGRISGRVIAGPRGEGWYVFEVSGGPGAALDALAKLRDRDILAAEPLLARQQQKRSLGFNDPLLGDAWHLENIGQGGGQPGIDVNISAAWSQVTGNGVTLGIVDDGVEANHPDLAANFDAADSYDFNGRDTNPTPPSYLGDDHGTSCAGVAAGVANNGLGSAGAAFDANLAALRLIALPTTDQDEADAFEFHNQNIDIKSNSWGPSDDGVTLEGPGAAAVAAMEDAVANGRGGKGTIILFAGGNGGDVFDNSNFDGYANRRETIAVAAADNFGNVSYYSDPGANLVIAAPSNGDRGTLGIVTTDRVGDDGYNIDSSDGEPSDINYTNSFGGTSSACPLAAGVVALILEKNPNLGWRDVQEILIQSAKKIAPANSGWVTNGGGYHFHHDFGAGLIDAGAAVTLAGTWTNLGPNFSYEEARHGLSTVIPDNQPDGVSFTFNVPDATLRVEHAQLTVGIAHARRGQLEITLTSPDGTVSRMAERRPDKNAHYYWTFMSTHHWGEMAVGDWKVNVADRVRGTTGTIQDLTLTLWGAAPNGSLESDGVSLHSNASAVTSLPSSGSLDVDFAVTNRGSATLTNLGIAFQNNATCSGTATTTTIASIAAGETKAIRATVQSLAAVGATAKATLALTADGGFSQSLATNFVTGTVTTATFTGSGAIYIPKVGKAVPYPSVNTVSGIPAGAAIVDVKLHLDHFAHERSADVDLLLVSPTGQKMIPLSDVGGEGASDVDLVLADHAETPLPEFALLGSGTYRPNNYGATVDTFAKPAPAKPFDFNFSTFKGQNPSGNWKLFLVDDKGRASGSIGAWSLEITYAMP